MKLAESKFCEAERNLQSLKCVRCQGSGKVDDAEPGDMYFNVFICPDCGGDGLRNPNEKSK